MRARCEDENNERYARYGGRGIKVCERWQSFENFLEDMGRCPPGMTIDRETNDDNYEPGKCRWATNIEQANKRSNNKLLTFDGRTQTLAQWAREMGMKQAVLRDRLRRGWPPALAMDPKGRRMKPGWKAKPRQKVDHPTLLCARCGTPFTAATSRSKWCSRSCGKASAAKTYYGKYANAINQELREKRAEVTDRRQTIHAQPCAACTVKLGRLDPHAPVLLDHEHCQAVLTQGLRIIATHAECRFAIDGAHLPKPT